MIGRTTVVSLLVVWGAAGAALAQETPDIDDLLAAAVETGTGESRSAWGEHAFERHVLRQKMNEEGVVEWKQEMRFQVTPTAEGFDETLLEIDGRRPTEAEVKEHRKAGRFEKRYEDSTEMVLENPFGPDLAVLVLLYDQPHEYVGVEDLDGIACHRIRWQAREEPSKLPAQEKLKYAMKGTLCISTETSDLIHADMETTRDVKQGPVKMTKVRIAFNARPVGDVYLPSKIEMVSHVKIALKRFRTHNIYRFTDYRKP